MLKQDILVIDDELEIRKIIADILGDEGYSVRQAPDEPTALTLIKESVPTVILLDLWIGDNESGGIEILEKIKSEHPNLPIIMISGHGTIDIAIEATRRGAYEFIEKPFVIDRLLLAVKRAVETSLLNQENLKLKKRIGQDTQLLGCSNEILQIKNLLKKVAETNSRVLIHGGVGVGSEVLAVELHNLSNRKNEPFIAFSCSGINANMLEKELFGEENEKGEILTEGVFGSVRSGTLLLEDITELPLEMQTKMIRILQNNAYKRVGGVQTIELKARIVSSTSQDINSLVADGKFKEELLYRLNVVPIVIPPIKDRRTDIEYIAEFFLTHAQDFFGLPSKKMDEEAMSILLIYDWPGNVRQLRNVIEWALIMSDGSDSETICADMLPPELRQSEKLHGQFSLDKTIGLPLKEARDEFEKEYLTMQISRFLGNVSKTAHFVGMERSALHRKIKLLGIGRYIDE